MQDLKKSKRKMGNKQMSNMKNNNHNNMIIPKEEIEVEEFDRGCNKSKNNCGCNNTNTAVKDDCGCNNANTVAKDDCGCNTSKHHHEVHSNQDAYNCTCVCTPKNTPVCEPCEVESDVCMKNKCGDECCCPINPTFSTKNTIPVAIEAERVYDAIQFQMFTDATGPDGEPLYFDYEVADVTGHIPTSGLVNIKIDEVCMNYCSIEVAPGYISLDDFEVVEIEDNAPCDTEFEYAVCPERSATCCSQCKGQGVNYKQKGLTVIVNDLVLELKGHCGCTKVVAYAYPAIRRMGGKLCRVDSVEFKYNTLAARLCCPSSGKSFTLRQDYDVNLTVDCIAKAYITAENYCDCDCDCDCYFNLEIPSGIDLICCLQEEVSVLVSQQIVVMGATGAVTPRVVDTFANVCNFPSCPGSDN